MRYVPLGTNNLIYHTVSADPTFAINFLSASYFSVAFHEEDGGNPPGSSNQATNTYAGPVYNVGESDECKGAAGLAWLHGCARGVQVVANVWFKTGGEDGQP